MDDYIMPDWGGGSPEPPATGWHVIGRHRSLGATISEAAAVDEAGRHWRRFTATIEGFQNCRLVAGVVYDPALEIDRAVGPSGFVLAASLGQVATAVEQIREHGSNAPCLVDEENLSLTKWMIMPYAWHDANASRGAARQEDKHGKHEYTL